MELRSTVCLAFLVLAVSQYTDGHSVQRRQAYDDTNYDEPFVADEPSDYETQNDDRNTSDTQEKPMKDPVVILSPQTTYEAEAGQDVRLECKLSADHAAVAAWYKDNALFVMGNVVLADDRYSIYSAPNTKDLLIKGVQPSDAGEFRCEIPQTVPAKVTHTLVVVEKPKVVNMTATNNGHVGEDNDVTLACAVTGIPAPQVMWSFTKSDGDDSNVRLTEKDGEFSVNGNVYSMFIKKIRLNQAGRYYCYAINKAGNHQGDIVVKVNAKPRVHVPRTIINSDIQVEAVLQCSAHEAPMPHIRWYKDGVLIEDSSSQFTVNTHGTHSNLTVTPVADQDFGTFTCEAENLYGKHNKSIDLVQSPVVENINVDGPKMTWTIHSHQPLEEMELQLRNIEGKGEWKRLSVPLPEGKGHKYDVTYTVESPEIGAGKYDAIIKVKNNKSWGSSVDPTLVEIVEDVQPQFIQHASVFRTGGAHSIRSSGVIISTVLMYLLVREL